MAEDKVIHIKGARVHNLKNIEVSIPRNQLVVITGLSGSGKSSLAFDTLYAEGQRRYVESLSAYARQFLGRIQKPEVDFIKGIPPAIAGKATPEIVWPSPKVLYTSAYCGASVRMPGIIIKDKNMVKKIFFPIK